MVIDHSLISVGMNEAGAPVCLIIVPESFPDDDVDVTRITGASMNGELLTLEQDGQHVTITDLTPALVEEINSGLPLILIDNTRQYERLIEIKKDLSHERSQ